MGMIAPHDLSNDLCTLLIFGFMRQMHFVHAVKDPALDGLHAIADIRKSTRYDYAHRIINIRLFHLGIKFHIDYFLICNSLHIKLFFLKILSHTKILQ